MWSMVTRPLLVWISALLLITLPADASEDFLPGEGNASTVEEARKLWDEQTESLRNAMESFIKRLFPIMVRLGSEAEISSECQGAYLKMFLAVRQLKAWAVKMIDASAKIPNGMLSGTMTSMGHFDECLDITAEGLGIRGKYCNLDLWLRDLPRPTRNTSLVVRDSESVMSVFYENGYWLRLLPGRFGLCVPSTCSREDIQKIAAHAGKDLKMKANITSCQVKEPTRLDLGHLVILSTLGIIALLVVIGTTLDVVSLEPAKHPHRHGSAFLVKLLVTFSVVKNTRELFRDSQRGPGTLDALDGIRVISCTWIVLGHIYFLTDISTYIRYGSLTKLQGLFTNFLFTMVENFSLPVDTFFFITGLLLVHTHAKKFARQEASFWGMCYTVAHRYWRVTPAFAVATALFVLLPLLGSGPMWKDVLGSPCGNCREHWWTNLVYISNYMPYSKMCMLHSWFLALNMQYYIVGIPIVLIMLRKPKVIAMLLATLTVLSVLATAAMVYVHKLPPAMLMMTSEWRKATQHLTLVYYQPFTHFGPFAVGLGLGYVLSMKKVPIFRRVTLVLGWAAALAACGFALFAVYPFRRGEHFSQTFSAAYAGSHRTLWAAGVAWITLLCSSGQAGILGDILSSSAMRPLSKLSYLIYLLHPIPIYIHVAATREAYHLDHYYMTILFFGVLLASIFMAYVAHVTVEVPCASLETLLFSGGPRLKANAVPNDQEEKKSPSYSSLCMRNSELVPKAPECSHL